MLPVFDLKPLKREFYTKLLLSVLILIAGYTIVASGILPKISFLPGKTAFFVLFGVFMAFQMWHHNQIKKVLETAIAATDLDEKYSFYTKYFNQKLLYSVADVAINSAFLIITLNSWFLYLNLLPLGFLLMGFPRKAIISMELKNNEIEVVG